VLFVEQVRPGDDLGVLVAGGHALLTGTVTGCYTFAAGDTAGLSHRRGIRWQRVVARSDFPRPAALQDVRPLFSVPWHSG